MSDEEISLRRKADAVAGVALWRPKLSVTLLSLTFAAALLEGIGVGFIVPIIELVRSNQGAATDPSGLLAVFVTAYDLIGVGLTLETSIIGVSVVMSVRFGVSFLAGWVREYLKSAYIGHLQSRLFDGAVDARSKLYDDVGSDEVLNSIITQTKRSGKVVMRLAVIVENLLISVVYLAIAFYISPLLAGISVLFLGSISLVFRRFLERGYDVGDRVADAEKAVQNTAQAAIQGHREVRLFGMVDTLVTDFSTAIDQYVSANTKLQRNKELINNFYHFLSAITVFLLIYLALTIASLSIGALGLFLFAMFRLAPHISKINDQIYFLEGELPHLVRAQHLVSVLARNSEPTDGDRNLPERVDSISFDDVHFTYDNERVLNGVSFEVQVGESIAFVGPSGAGKSTIVELLARLYEPDEGRILVNDIPIQAFDRTAWRGKIAVVQQDPYIFDETLRYNLTLGGRETATDELDRVCEIARVSEFFGELPNGYDTILGEDGVKLSGGQRQRVALARALLKDADLLVLDEATSDLDSRIEADVQSAIESMNHEYAIVTVAHRLSTVTDADRIYTIEQGTISEVGDHGDLIEKEGTYAELYHSQMDSTSSPLD